MKCRYGHVTNSSSSSFIIAKHEGFKKEDLRTALNSMRDDIKQFLESHEKYIYFEDDEIKYLLKKNKQLLYVIPLKNK